MSPLARTVLAAVCLAFAALFEVAERHDNRSNHELLRTSGFFFGLAVAFVGWALFF